MALYEYQCGDCGKRFEKRMPMGDALQLTPCSDCGAQAKKVIGNFAVVGRAEAGIGDGPAPWEDSGEEDGGGESEVGGADDITHHGHSHGPGGHSHPHSH
ncbi:MAG: hypothetical protein CL897_03645 [Dehalococcoidia bacterium]|nr:hypothetical protein [Dehalococcoidia bacterium]HCU99618.1 hypothetical protein [Dehalococcoidia bacterium]